MRKRLLALLSSFDRKKIAVVGDLIADEFLYGQIARVSREAPVLILQYRETTRMPGGAANAANNLLELGGRVRVVGPVGRDEAGRYLVRMLDRRGADTRLVSQPAGYATPVKTRILAGARHSAPQQVVRIDRVLEIPSDYTPPFKSAARAFRDCDGVILSDYGYGAASPALAGELGGYGRRRSIPVVGDSRFRMCDFCDVTSLTPNITELEAATGTVIGDDAALLHKKGLEIVRRQNLEHLLVTQGRFGMTLIHAERPPLHIPIYGTDDVADVTGAGDTVIAVFTLALACGGDPAAAARLANSAGGIVVMKRGTATVSRRELEETVRDDLG